MALIIAIAMIIVAVSTQIQNNSPVYQPQQDYDMVIIANSTFYEYDGEWDLQRLADWHDNNDTISCLIVNLSTIYTDSRFWVNGTYGDGNVGNPFKRVAEGAISNYEMFNDSSAQIRNYIRYVNYEMNVTYALLVGDVNPMYFPTRFFFANSSGAPAMLPPDKNGYDPETGEYDPQADYHVVLPTDMYYSCLNGTFNQNENENSASLYTGWGQNLSENGLLDEAWWNYTVAVGRFPCDNTETLGNMVRKTITYMSLPDNTSYLQNVTLAGMGGGWNGPAKWLCNFSKTLNGTIYNDWVIGSTKGFNPDEWNIKVIDSNPDRVEGVPFYDANSRGSFNDGCHIWYQSSHGSDSGWYNSGGEGDDFFNSDIQALTNWDKPTFVLSCIPCQCAEYDKHADSFAEEFLKDENGAFAGLFNTRYGWGDYDTLNSSSHFIGSQIINAYMDGHNRIGDMVAIAKEYEPDWQEPRPDESIRWATFEQILFGDPAVQLKTYTVQDVKVQFISVDGRLNGTTVYTSNPTFNWTVGSNISQYQLQIANDSGFADLVVNITDINNANYPTYYTENSTRVSFVLPPAYSLDYDKTYYCRVILYVKGGD